MSNSQQKANSFDHNKLLWVLKHFVAQKWLYLSGFIVLILTNWLYTRMPLYFKQAVNIIQGLEKDQQLNSLLIKTVLLAVLIILVRTLSRTLFFNPARIIEANIKNELYTKLSRLPPDFFANNQTGSIISKINNDITYLRVLYGFVTLQSFNLIFLFSLAPINMWAISPRMTIYSLVPLVLGFILVRYGIHFIRFYTNKRSQDLQGLSSFTISILNGLDMVRSYQIGDWVKNRFKQQRLKLLEDTMAIVKWRVLTMPVLMNLEEIIKIVIFTATFIAMTRSGLNDDSITAGDLVAFLGYISLLAPPLASLGWLTTVIRQSFIAINNLYEIQSTPERPSLNIAPYSAEKLNQEFSKGIRINNLSFSYQESKKPFLDNISLVIKPNQIIGVLGAIGSGKTTLVNCLNKYLPVSSGMISIGDLDSTQVNENDWRKVILTISQDPFLFSGTISENINFHSSQTLTAEKMQDIIEKSALQQEILQFPQGVDTLVGERGITLSGGQKQRVAIARALVSKSKLLILDNVLSAVDYETEKFLIKHLFNSDIAESLLIVSHRINAIRFADWIIVLDEGRVIEQGQHSQLLDLGGYYAETWRLQNTK